MSDMLDYRNVLMEILDEDQTMTTLFTHIDELETPSILINLDIVEANISRTQARCNELNLRLRPHIKTHKMPEFARMQIEAGAQGIACQKVSEAEVFADAGFNDIQIPYNIVGECKTARLAELAKRCNISVTVDSIAVVDGIVSACEKPMQELAYSSNWSHRANVQVLIVKMRLLWQSIFWSMMIASNLQALWLIPVKQKPRF